MHRLEGARIGYGRVPLPNGPEIIPAGNKVVLRFDLSDLQHIYIVTHIKLFDEQVWTRIASRWHCQA